MTTRRLAVALLGALLCAAPVLGQVTAPVGQPPADDTQGAPLDINLRSVDFGVRLTDVSGDEARFNRYQDFRSGAVLQGFRFTKETDERLLHAEADNVGYRDQRFSAEMEQFGKFKTWFEYNQIPYFQSADTRSIYTQQGDALRADDALQAAVQAGVPAANIVDGFASPFELRIKRDITTVGMQYQASRNTDLNLSVVSTGRSGNQIWAGGFGFTLANEMPARVDQRTTDIAANVEWANKKGLLRVGYDGSLFNSNAETLTWDSPLRITDITTASSQGRMSRWPSSTMHSLSATGSLALPAKSRLTGYVARSALASDVDLLPHTINTAIAAPALERQSLDADADVTAAMVRFTSRPVGWMWLNANYRSYDFANNTPVLRFEQMVNYDSTLLSTPGGQSHPLSFNRGVLDLDASLTPWRHGAFRIGYTREDVDRTHRIFETTVDNAMRVGYDWTSNAYVTVRANYVHSERRGEGFDPEVLDEVSEQPGMRHFDIADRDRDVAQFVVTAMPTSTTTLTFNASKGQDEFPDTYFGLRSQDVSSVGVGFDFLPTDVLSAGVMYNYETYSSYQASRTANPGVQFLDPTRDWFDDGSENVHAFTVYLDLPKLGGKTDLSIQYDYNDAESTYSYSLASPTTLPAPAQLSPVTNTWQQARLDTKYWLRRNLAIGLSYLYDRFEASDFALSPSTIDRIAYPSTLLMQYTWAPYTANTVWLKATYLW